MKEGRLKYDKKTVILLMIEFFLLLVLLVMGMRYMQLENRLKELGNTVTTKEAEKGMEDIRSEYADYKYSIKNKEIRESKAISLVEGFLRTYFESNSSSPYERLLSCEGSLSDTALRQLCPYDNDPTEISSELLEKIRKHDATFLNSGQNGNDSYVNNMTVYYRGDSSSKEQVLVYFTLETIKKGSNHSNKTVYLFECTVGDPEGDMLITDIILKTPVLLPAYDPDVSITN